MNAAQTSTKPTRHATPSRRWSRRGVSLIEVVMASLLLAIIASAVVGGITTVIAGDARNQQKLEALELANRLLLQYVDDKEAMPDQEAHVTQGRGTYRWVMRTSPVQLTMPEQSVIDKPTTGPGGKAVEKLKLLAVSVHTGVPDGMGGFAYGERVCTLSRVYHPLSVIYRNPNKMAAISNDPAELIRIFAEFLGDNEPAVNPNASAPGPSLGSSGPAARLTARAPKPASSGELFSGSHSIDNRTR